MSQHVHLPETEVTSSVRHPKVSVPSLLRAVETLDAAEAAFEPDRVPGVAVHRDRDQLLALRGVGHLIDDGHRLEEAARVVLADAPARHRVDLEVDRVGDVGAAGGHAAHPRVLVAVVRDRRLRVAVRAVPAHVRVGFAALLVGEVGLLVDAVAVLDDLGRVARVDGARLDVGRRVGVGGLRAAAGDQERSCHPCRHRGGALLRNHRWLPP